MKKAFAQINKGLKKIAKYFVFSTLFVLTGLISTQVRAAVPQKQGDSYYDDYVNKDGIQINGEIKNNPAGGNCINDKYNLIGGSYISSNKGNIQNSNCVAYQETDKDPIYYVQAKDSKYSDKSTWNTLNFTVNSPADASNPYNFVVVTEPHFTSSADNPDYDIFTYKNGQYVYENVVAKENGVGGSKLDGRVGTISYEKGVYTFSYQLRNADFTSHTIYVYFYNSEADKHETSKEVQIKFTLARPIVDYTFNYEIKNTAQDSDKCFLTNRNEICISYVKNPNTGDIDNQLKVNNFTVTFNQDAAFYFSTARTHYPAPAPIDSDQIHAYNSIYATNTFYNQDDVSHTNPIVYEYYNFIDKTSYKPNSITTSDKYEFTLEIDAMGKYRFFITDIFGNELTYEADESTLPDIDDVSNRALTIYYLIYEVDEHMKPTGEEGHHVIASFGDNIEKGVLDYQLKGDSLDNITNENLTIGLEFYSTIKIDSDHAVGGQGSKGNILQNPLSYNGVGATGTEIRINDSSTNYTYFCRTDSQGNCHKEANDETNYIEQPLIDTQSIDGIDEYGLKPVSNVFNPSGKYSVGQLGQLSETEAFISRAQRNNKTQIVLNENGIYKVALQDIYGNTKISTIKVSIIDQRKPVITVDNNPQNLTNYICSNMYVIGGGSSKKDDISTYPEGALTAEDCSAVSTVYNNYEDADTTPGAEISILKRQDGSEINTLGFYNRHADAVRFNYADAIRIGLIRAVDHVVIGKETTKEKSIYEKKADNKYYTEYSLLSLNREGTKNDITETPQARVNFGYKTLNGQATSDDLVIKNNYSQYSSELEAYVGREYVKYEVYNVGLDNLRGDKIICDSIVDRKDGKCDDIVNTLIDKGMNFEMDFYAQDYAGNISNKVTVRVNVLDNTTPGITSIDEEGMKLDDPIIYKNNLSTKCRLEVGSKIQSKSQLMECYGFLKEQKYNFVDNFSKFFEYSTTNYVGSDYIDYQLATNPPVPDRVYNKTLSDQLYINGVYGTADNNYKENNSYYNHIKVYVCTMAESTLVGQTTTQTCSNDSDANWNLVEENPNIVFDNAGNYKIKFVLTDVENNYLSNSKASNTTSIVLCYYVNPRVLLVRPKEISKTYGDANPRFGYCVYATTNTDSFFYNLFDIEGARAKGDTTYLDTYDFVKKNYESEEFGLVYCTPEVEYVRNDEAKNSTLNEVLANDSPDISIEGNVNYTYATGANKYNMELNPAETYNAYQDAGYYYMTMGDLRISDNYKQNYIVRLHPGYLLDENIPNKNLKNYDSDDIKKDDTYKYGSNNASHGETISNVIYTINQTDLNISAIDGSKNYATPDTNYPQYSNNLASVNVASFTNINGETKNISTAGYLNGFNVDGLINSETVKDFDHIDNKTGEARHQYDNIINGFLRREIGEDVGVYRICNSNTTINGDCDISITEKIKSKNIPLADNVYLDYATSKKLPSGDEIRYGMYVKVDGHTVKLTRDNTISENGKITTFVNTILTTTWKYDYDDSSYGVQILPNANNKNQNYYINYTSAEYVINPSNIVIQPGSNQGKEYSNPQHSDPLFEIVVFGEQDFVTSGGYQDGFNGFTEAIADIEYPEKPKRTDAPYAPMDTDIYFNERRTTSFEKFKNAIFTYQYDLVDLDDNKNFIWQGQTYHFDEVATENNVCLATSIVNGKYTQCQTNKIGVFNISKDSSGKIKVTTTGKLTYQNYKLFAAGEGLAGTGNITREDGDNINVGWYNYNFTTTGLHAIYNSKETNVCTNEAYVFSIKGKDETRGNSKCANYNVSFDDVAPKKIPDPAGGDKHEYLTIAHTAPDAGYLHDGTNYCGSDIYSLSCQGSDGKKVTNIKFSIFKRDIILSFNAFDFVYENLYSFFENGIFSIDAQQATVPIYPKEGGKPILTCYRKDPSGKYSHKNGNHYTQLTTEECETDDYGISNSDYWGPDSPNGLKLKFYLAEYIKENFNKEHAIPAGLYYVYAQIGTNGVHPNYNLVYIDYDELTKVTPGQKAGAIEITSRPVDLVGTYYQKEFGQASYNSYGINDSALKTKNIGKGNYESVLDNLKSSITNNNKIFDNHYFHCVKNTANTLYNGVNVVMSNDCFIEEDKLTDHSEYKGNRDFGYANINNIFLYTITKVEGNDASGIVDGNTAGKITDQITANFVGTPIRTTVTGSKEVNENDPYGLLENVGFYKIDLSDVEPALTNYKDSSGDLIFGDKTVKSTIYRYTNYKIENKTDGGLYITPASIEINVSPDQKKMYGCAYNTYSTNGSLIYKYGVGYKECIETNGQYFDLGYQYSVSKDKYNWLKNKMDGDKVYPSFNACSNVADRNNGSNCTDVVYDNNDKYNYTVTPNYNSQSADAHNKPTNTALNEGTLYRMPGVYEDGNFVPSIEYSYKTYFDYATHAQESVGSETRVYQNQSVGKYFITLGNLDSKYNGLNVCSESGTPLSKDGQYSCKNFVVNYDGNNTAGHTKNASNIDHFVEGDDLKTESKFELSNPDLIFEIFERDVVIHTEYNYKVFGDTEPNEGFTCADLSKMYPGLNYAGRDYCDEDNKFIKTGVTRYYAVNNSLAKAPWTSWTLETNSNNASSHNKYEDILFDVIDPKSQIIREGKNNGLTNADRDDPGGIYHYIYKMYLNETLNGTNYVISYIQNIDDANESIADNKIPESKVDNLIKGYDYGFATKDQDPHKNKLHRWYTDNKHKCHSVVDSSVDCDTYTGNETYNFHIDGIKKMAYSQGDPLKNKNLFVAGEETIISNLQPIVYFEIVHREIYMKTRQVTKDYGIEENYNDFGLDLVIPTNPGVDDGQYTPIKASTKWGDAYSLSLEDYKKFYPNGEFSLAAFSGSDNDSDYRGSHSDRAFGIYYYRARGEEIGDYRIVACPTQSEGDRACHEAYKTDADGKSLVKTFKADVSTNEFNASNYIIHTIPSTINIIPRGVHITPDSNQEFMYGNYETGKMLPPITFTESYTPDKTSQSEGAISGLVNGKILDQNDNIKNQIAYCIYDITGAITCINDRQNTQGLDSTQISYITTTLHNTSSVSSKTMPTTGGENPFINSVDKPATKYMNHNVYNDEYNQDNDGDRNALDRVIKGSQDNLSQRYNRNVGTYIIVPGELAAESANTCEGETGVNCVDRNYKITGFTSNVEYTITPATVKVTPKDGQNKTYGVNDPEIKFSVATEFEFETLPADTYYCDAAKDNCQYSDETTTYEFAHQTDAQTNADGKIIIYLNGFAYNENVMADANINGDYNYGIAKVGNKLASSNSQASLTTNQPAENADGLKYFDKYCYQAPNGVEKCSMYTAEHPQATVSYEATDRILLGYFYVTNWDQRAIKHVIKSGMMVAQNEFGNPNYLYKNALDKLVAIDEETGVEFTINKLNIDATMPTVEDEKLNPGRDQTLSISKTYGQATDAYKADDFTHECKKDSTTINCVDDHAKLFAKNNEHRLEYNFNVNNTKEDHSVYDDTDGVVVLTSIYNGHYYTQTATRETKNIHLGVSVVRKKVNDNVVCLADDKYGCEDVDDYTLAFRKNNVKDNVDLNYNITYGGVDQKLIEDTDDKYLSVKFTKTTIDQPEGIDYLDHITADYDVYPNNRDVLDIVNELEHIQIVQGYTMKLQITKRSVTFYVGTYETDGRVAERYIIEQNEQVPEFPELRIDFTTSTKDPYPSKDMYSNTWFDTKEYQNKTQGIPRQVRTKDQLKTTLKEGVGQGANADKFGVGICTKSISGDIQNVKFGDAQCGDFIQYYQTNLKNPGTDGYYFDTSNVGDYAIIRNHDTTYITYEQNELGYDYEKKNYDVTDHNGTLVIYADKTAPIISVGNATFPIEANAHTVDSTNCIVVNEPGKSFAYNCKVNGKLFDENNKTLGDIISYITNNYSGYKSGTTNDNSNKTKMPTELPNDPDTSGWTYQPVNNIGNAESVNTLYEKDRSDNTYGFSGTVINSRLNAVSSIISWFNVTSYDYSFIRNGHYVPKRYTPRYYFYIGDEHGGDKVFDPTYVGDITLHIYAIDNVGNMSSVDVTLQIVDTTKPVTGEMHIFNSQVVCDSTNCKTNTIDTWFVQAGYVDLNAFRKYDADGNPDEVNGHFIKLNGKDLLDIYKPSQVTRYKRNADGTYSSSVTGEYIEVKEKITPAVEVEHMSWYNKSTLYLVVVGGKDNSYIHDQEADTLSQWNTYYTFDGGSTWHKYDRHASTGTAIDFVDGVSKVYTQVIDSGRAFKQTVDGKRYFYNDIYLTRNSVCEPSLGGDCHVISKADQDNDTVTEVTDLEMTPGSNEGDFTFKINGTTVHYNSNTNIITWSGIDQDIEVSNGKFSFGGLMTCTITGTKVSCQSEYHMIYKTNDKISIDKIVYTIQEAKNIGELDNGDETAPRFYYDRRYVLVDTHAPIIDKLNGDIYSVYEYTNTCDKNTVGGENETCYSSYDEYFLATSDAYKASSITQNGTTSEPSNPGLTTMSESADILLYTGNGQYSKYDSSLSEQTSLKNNYSGILKNDSNITSGNDKYDNFDETVDEAGNHFTNLSKFRTNIVVYLATRTEGSKSLYKYTVIFDGSKYIVLRQQAKNDSELEIEGSYDLLTDYTYDVALEKKVTLTTIEDVLEFIVSTASIPSDKIGSYLDFSINYTIKDAAGNSSSYTDNGELTVRGITYVKYASVISAKNSLRAFSSNGDNSYIIKINQGVNFNSVVDNFVVNNIDYNGENHNDHLLQSIYYNGEVLPNYENIPYTDDAINELNNIAKDKLNKNYSVPGQYSLKITNVRNVEVDGKIKQIEDKPLIVTFDVVPAVTDISNQTNSVYALVGLISVIIALFSVIGIGILFYKKRS